MSNVRRPHIIKKEEWARYQQPPATVTLDAAVGFSSLPMRPISPHSVSQPSPKTANGHVREAAPVGDQRDVAAEVGQVLRELAAYRGRVIAETERLLAEARQEAAALRAQAEAEAQQLREDARRQGFSEGYEQGAEQARREWEERVRSIVDALHRAVEEAEAARQTIIERSRDDILKLALAIAEKVVRREISSQSDVTHRLLDELLPRWQGVERLVIRCHPDEAPKIAAYLKTSRHPLVNGALEIVPSDDVQPGGCVVESQFGQLDARVETRLGEIGRRLMEWLHDGS